MGVCNCSSGQGTYHSPLSVVLSCHFGNMKSRSRIFWSTFSSQHALTPFGPILTILTFDKPSKICKPRVYSSGEKNKRHRQYDPGRSAYGAPTAENPVESVKTLISSRSRGCQILHTENFRRAAVILFIKKDPRFRFFLR
jgi:hypothetical protein